MSYSVYLCHPLIAKGISFALFRAGVQGNAETLFGVLPLCLAASLPLRLCVSSLDRTAFYSAIQNRPAKRRQRTVAFRCVGGCDRLIGALLPAESNAMDFLLLIVVACGLVWTTWFVLRGSLLAGCVAMVAVSASFGYFVLAQRRRLSADDRPGVHCAVGRHLRHAPLDGRRPILNRWAARIGCCSHFWAYLVAQHLHARLAEIECAADCAPCVVLDDAGGGVLDCTAIAAG